jgi:hypothetical protein
MSKKQTWPRGYWARLSEILGTSAPGAKHKLLNGGLTDKEFEDAKQVLIELRSKQELKEARRNKVKEDLLSQKENQ